MDSADLHHRYLPWFDFREVYQTEINASPEIIYPIVRARDFSGSWIMSVLMFLRGIPSKALHDQGTLAGKFLVMEEIENREIIIGLIGEFWRASGNLQDFTPETFRSFPGAFAKATWNFKLSVREGKTILSTETRIACPDKKTKKKFSRYWHIIRPFSGLIRREMLSAIRKKAEKSMKQRL